MLIEDQYMHNKSIMVSILGAPNVGKSSLINYLLGYDLAIVTHKEQTTRNKFHCVMNVDHTEIVMVDTPGLHHSNQEINKRMNEQALESLDGADLNLLLVDLTREVLKQIVDFKKMIEADLTKTWLVFTKSDRITDVDNLPLDDVFEKAKEIMPSLEKYFVISSKEGTNVHELTGGICDEARPGHHLYPRGDVSNKNERFFATEYIREQAFLLLKEELPYELAVVIDDYKDVTNPTTKKRTSAHISATILVNRPSQRGIVVGKGGSMIKEIGIRSREKIQKLIGSEAHLNLHVKVSPRWFKNNFVLEELGLPRAKNSARVWRNS